MRRLVQTLRLDTKNDRGRSSYLHPPTRTKEGTLDLPMDNRTWVRRTPDDDNNILPQAPRGTKVIDVSPDSMVSTVLDVINLPPERADHFRACKAAVRASDGEMDEYPMGEIPGVPGGPWTLSPRSREKYQFILRNELFYVEASSWSNMPPVRIDPAAQLIAEVGFSKILDLTCKVAAWVLGREDLEQKNLKPSRFDFKADFQHPKFKIPERLDMVTYAKQGDRRDEDGVVTSYTLGLKSSGFQVQVYNKTSEALAKGKDWLFDVWAANKSYRSNLDVYRLEMRMFRTSLRAFDMNSWSQVESFMPGLLYLAIGGPSPWIRFTRTSDRNKPKAERRNAKWFVSVLAGIGDLMPSFKDAQYPEREKIVRPKETVQRAYRRVVDALVSYAAVGRSSGQWSGEDPVYLCRRIFDDLQAENRELKTSWMARVLQKVDKIPWQLHDQRNGWAKVGLGLC